MPETLESVSCVKLFGRVVTDLNIGAPPAPSPGPPAPPPVQPPNLGTNLFLQGQLRAAGATIARIYGFSYEGHYYDLARPALFLVHGPGQVAERPGPPPNRGARAPDETDRTGIAYTPKSFSEDMRVWAYDKGDLSIRFDVETGSFEQILLHVELSTDRLGLAFSGKAVRLRGPLGGND